MRLIYCCGALLLSLFACQPDSQNADYTLQPADTPAGVEEGRFARNVVQPPNPALDVPLQTVSFDAEEGLVYRHPSGSTLSVPAGAFVDAAGNPVRGAVELHYREFHHAADLVVAGIPLKAADQDGRLADMQTAGMVEVRATQADTPLRLAAGRSLELDMASHVDDAVYDTWSLDEQTGDWTNTGTSTARPNPARVPVKPVAAPPAPAAPVAFRGDRPILDFDFNQKVLADLNLPKGVLWQYAGDDAGEARLLQSNLRGTAWNYADLEPIAGKATYRLVLKSKDQTIRTEVAPTLKGAKLEAAVAAYQTQLAAYKQNLREATGRELVLSEKAEFMRSMQLNNLGIHNFDLLMGMPNTVRVYASFDYGTGDESLNRGTDVFLITNDARSVLRFTPDNFDQFVFNPDQDNKLVALLPGNRIATFSQAEFAEKAANLRGKNGSGYTFRMTVHPNPLTSAKDLDRVLRKLG